MPSRDGFCSEGAGSLRHGAKPCVVTKIVLKDEDILLATSSSTKVKIIEMKDFIGTRRMNSRRKGTRNLTNRFLHDAKEAGSDKVHNIFAHSEQGEMFTEHCVNAVKTTMFGGTGVSNREQF